jgi:hypothetical protein
VRADLARGQAADPDPRLSARLEAALRGVIAGTADPREFTPAMQAFLSTATARGLGEWIGSHGRLTSLRYALAEPIGADRVVRYRAAVGDASLWFSFRITADNRIAQIYWW